MPLLLAGQSLPNVPRSVKHLYEFTPDLKQNSGWFASRAPKVVDSVGLLYVTQREFAVTFPHDKCISVVGSDDATTCLVVSLRHSVSGVTCIFHFDGGGLDEAVAAILSKMESLSSSSPSARYEVHIVGGYEDERQISEDLILSLLQALHKQPMQLDVLTLCVGEANTLIRGGINHPIITGLGVDLKSGEVFPAIFPDKGPEMALRCARHLTGSQQMLDIYDSNTSLLRIGPFKYEPLRGSDLWLSQSDSFILQTGINTPGSDRRITLKMNASCFGKDPVCTNRARTNDVTCLPLQNRTNADVNMCFIKTDGSVVYCSLK